jgi:hypothetical protein
MSQQQFRQPPFRPDLFQIWQIFLEGNPVDPLTLAQRVSITQQASKFAVSKWLELLIEQQAIAVTDQGYLLQLDSRFPPMVLPDRTLWYPEQEPSWQQLTWDKIRHSLKSPTRAELMFLLEQHYTKRFWPVSYVTLSKLISELIRLGIVGNRYHTRGDRLILLQDLGELAPILHKRRVFDPNANCILGEEVQRVSA